MIEGQVSTKANRLKEWRENLTPEEREAWKTKIREGRLKVLGRGAVSGRKDFSGIRVNISEVLKGRYVKGSSRTLLVSDVVWPSTDTAERVAGFLKELKKTGTARVGRTDVIVV